MRIKKFQKKMLDSGLDAILLTYSRSIFYYAGTTQPSVFIITPEEYYLLVLRGFELALEETWLEIDKIHSGSNSRDAKKILKNWKIKRGYLGMELDMLPALEYFKFTEIFPEFEIIDISELILEQRKIKDDKEIDYTRKACKIAHRGHKKVLEVLRVGMTELELSAEIENAHRKAEHEGFYFMRPFDFFMGPGPLASGANLSKIAGKIQSISGVGLSSSIPMGASKKAIKKSEMIVVDIPTHHFGYHADQSRTYVLGRPPEICKTMYSGMIAIADQLIETLKPGSRCDALYKQAFTVAEEMGLSDYFMRLGIDRKKIPFIGHGVGLELNEPPLLSYNNQEVLEEGMVIALELEMSASIGEVVKLEDTLLITSYGAEILTITPRELHQV